MSDNSGSSINAFLLGLIIGGALGVLFAPDRGEETRKKIKQNYKEWSKKALEVAEELQEEVEPRVERVTETIEPILPAGRQVVQEVRPVVEEITGEAKEIAQPRVEAAGQGTGRYPAGEKVKREFDQTVERARAELRRRTQQSRPQQFKGV